MKYLIILLLGLAVGAAIALGLLFYNPFTSQMALSPLAVSDRQQITLRYSAVVVPVATQLNEAPTPSQCFGQLTRSP